LPKAIILLPLVSIIIACMAAMNTTDGSMGVDTPSSPATDPAKAAAILELPTLTDAKPRDYRGLHNVVAFFAGYWSGSVPEGDAGFDTLGEMGVRTIISVDGAEPDLARARARGIRYIHLPIGYNGFDEKRKLELVRATRDALQQGPVYIHCHHGKHRSAGAAGTAVASLGLLTPDEATARMKVSGTALNYKGLYACTANATALDNSVIDAVPAEFPEVSQPATFVKSMIEIDEINDRLKWIEKAGWTVPADHPDLVPAAEAGRMADLFRLASQGDMAQSNPADFAAALAQDADRMQALENLIVEGERDVKKLSDQFRLIQNSCKDCHAAYRD
jgi:hypothetical protein